MKNMYLRVLSTVIIALIIVLSSITSNALHLNYNKMDSLLRSKINEVEENDKLPVSIWINDVDHNEIKKRVDEKRRNWMN